MQRNKSSRDRHFLCRAPAPSRICLNCSLRLRGDVARHQRRSLDERDATGLHVRPARTRSRLVRAASMRSGGARGRAVRHSGVVVIECASLDVPDGLAPQRLGRLGLLRGVDAHRQAVNGRRASCARALRTGLYFCRRSGEAPEESLLAFFSTRLSTL